MKFQWKQMLCVALSLVACREDGASTVAQATAEIGASNPSSHPYTLFESGQVRPLAISDDKNTLFAVNSPDNRLELFQIASRGLRHTASVSVGLEPVAVAVRNDHEVWVVNHLSDSVSIVDVSDPTSPRVVRTLLVGDEPRDIVFGGAQRRRAFITTAHRGQNLPFDPQLTTPGVGRADVWVFDAQALGNSLGGTPLTVVTMFTDTPRALAVTPDGTRVYAAGFHTGNQTVAIGQGVLPAGFGPDGVPGPATDAMGNPAPDVGTVVKWNGAHWVDPLGRTRDQYVKFNLPDKDVFVIDANANPPKQLVGTAGSFSGVGTILFGMAVNPVNGKVYVSNTDANNLDRFEGPGTFTGHSLRGHLHESRITVLSPGSGNVQPRHLNKHVNYDVCCAATPNAESTRSLALPQGMAVSSNGANLYVAALGSNKVGFFSTAEIENNTFTPNAANHVVVSGGGPTGLVLDEGRHQLYVMTRFDDGISVIDTTRRAETSHVKMYSPEPASVVNGRRFLYDASISSSHGDSSCASCHVFGDFDSLAWNLGNPDGQKVHNPGPFASALFNLITGQPMEPEFHPMKGPMSTQSLRGMANHGPMHWRGDRTGGNDAPSAQPDSGTFDERAGFKKFQPAFADLLGKSAPLGDADMNAFTDFILQVTYPPNPNQPLDSSYTPDQAAGQALFNSVNCGIPACLDPSCGPRACAACHNIDRNANPSSAAPGIFGTSSFSTFDFNPQLFKIPHLRNLYQKIGMFGNPVNPGFIPGDNDWKGDQVRGVGFLHDGSVDTVFRFHHGLSFAESTTGAGNGGFANGPAGETQRRQVESFLFAFPTNLAPIVGQQITFNRATATISGPRIDLLRQRADAGDCDLVAKAQVSGEELGFYYTTAAGFASDRRLLHHLSDAFLRALALTLDFPLTYTCVPPGSGPRVGIDRDQDGYLDGDERDLGSDSSDPNSTPFNH